MSTSRRILGCAAAATAIAALMTPATAQATAGANSDLKGSAPVRTVPLGEQDGSRLDFAAIARTAKPLAAPTNVPATRADSLSRGTSVRIAPVAPKAAKMSSKLQAEMRDTNAGGLWPGAPTANPNRQVGKLYFDTDPGPAVSWSWCTATAVNSENKSTLITAGHCVWNTSTRQWYTNVWFAPGYQYGATQGWYSARTMSTTWNYYNSGTSADDMGAVVVNAGSNGRIVDVLGGHGSWFNGATNQYRTSLGYPITDWRWPGYTANGEDARYCQGTDYYYGSGTFAGQNYLGCRMTGGASGGPWLTWVQSNWMGYVNSVNSNKGGIGSSWAGVMFGPYFNNPELQVFNTVRAL